MKYGFDLDGTLDRPVIRDLCNILFDAGHEIYVITGGIADTGEWTEEARKEKLLKIGAKYTKIIRCLKPSFPEIAEEKDRMCKELSIDLFFDDMPVYIDAVKKNTQCLFVV
jgi:tagatose-1,6-bisphosphate aldolase